MLFLGLVAFGALALGLRVAVIETDLEQLWVEGKLLTLVIAALLGGAQDEGPDEELVTESQQKWSRIWRGVSPVWACWRMPASSPVSLSAVNGAQGIVHARQDSTIKLYPQSPPLPLSPRTGSSRW